MENKAKYKDLVPRWVKPKAVNHWPQIIRGLIRVFAWTGVAILYYVAFSFFFDTPLESAMKLSTAKLGAEYDSLSSRYDMMEKVLDNVVERDRDVFHALFESDPYSFDSDLDAEKWDEHEALLARSEKLLLTTFNSKLGTFEARMARQSDLLDAMMAAAESELDELNHIPSVQPVINPELTLLTASYGMLIHPFYKTLASHQGVDFTVGEGSQVFATADGTVKEVVTRNASSGNTVVIDHGNSYETSYSHLDRILVARGRTVRRGDIIAYSGNTGLSLAPHLHYEIRHNGMRIDPIHYFFMELDHKDYMKIMRIAQTGMQSFD